MRVLQVNKFNYLRGGADKYFLELCELLQSQGIEVAKFCMDHPDNLPDKYSRWFVSNVDFTQFRLNHWWRYLGRMMWSFEARRKFSRLLDEFKPDLVHLHNIYHQISPSILPVAKKRGIPVVMHVHDYKLICPNYKLLDRGKICHYPAGQYWWCFWHKAHKNSYLKSLLVTLEMYLHHRVLDVYQKNIDLYLTPSQFVKDELVKYGFPAAKIKVLYHFLETDKFKSDYQLGDYFVYLGRLDIEKGVDTLLHAMTKITDARLKIIGFGPEYKNLQALSKKLKLSGRVQFLGPKHDDELKKIVAQSYAIVAPSKWYEVFGLVILEAAALGKAVIASRIGGIPEALQEGKTAMLFQYDSAADLADKLNWALNHPTAIEAMGRAGRQFVEQNFTPAKHWQGLKSIYTSLTL